MNFRRSNSSATFSRRRRAAFWHRMSRSMLASVHDARRRGSLSNLDHLEPTIEARCGSGATSSGCPRHVRFTPVTDRIFELPPQQTVSLFDHLVGAGEKRGWRGKTRARPDQSGFMPANFRTLAHLSISCAIMLPNSADEPPIVM